MAACRRSAAYGATKAALINMCASLKFGLDPEGITMQVVCPGFVGTPLTAKNDFPMPFLIPAEEAARRICDGFERSRIRDRLPAPHGVDAEGAQPAALRLYFPLVARATGRAEDRGGSWSSGSAAPFPEPRSGVGDPAFSAGIASLDPGLGLRPPRERRCSRPCASMRLRKSACAVSSSGKLHISAIAPSFSSTGKARVEQGQRREPGGRHEARAGSNPTAPSTGKAMPTAPASASFVASAQIER